MSGTSKITRVFRFRLPNALADILERRAARHENGISGYVRDRLAYDLERKHHKRREPHETNSGS